MNEVDQLIERLRNCAKELDAMPSRYDARTTRLDSAVWACTKAAALLAKLQARVVELETTLREAGIAISNQRL